MDRNTREFGDRLRLARERAGLTQGELGALVGASGRTVGNWERGETYPRNKIGALERELGVSLTDGPGPDRVVAAIEGSDLSRSQQSELLTVYWRIRERAERGEVG